MTEISQAVSRAVQAAGNQADLASLLGVSQQSVSAWLQGRSRVPADKAILIERVTKGVVKLSDVRPDLSRLLAG